jgi:PAS domain S-box-containing protein
MAGIVSDVTERKTAEEAVKESEETFSKMFHALPIGVSLATYPDEKLTNVNKEWLNLAEYSDLKDVLGKTKVELGVITAQDMERINSEFTLYGNVRNAETTFYSKNGQQNNININKDIIHIGGKKFVLSTNEDITNQKKYEQEIKQKNEELTRFIYTVSHDLKSPLVTIKSFTSYLKEDIEANDKAVQDKDIGYIENAADKMGRLLDELLELSRIGRKEEPKTEVSLETIVKTALDLTAGRISQRKVNANFTAPSVMLYGFSQRLIQLFQNLIDNAVKFMGDQTDPRIEIGAYQDDQKNDVVIYVRDNGSGIDPRYHHKIFGLFEKMDNKTEGSGIGLALVKRIVEVHEGSKWFESEGVGKGTTFYFTLKNTHIVK